MNTELAREIIASHTSRPIPLVVRAVRALAISWAVGL